MEGWNKCIWSHSALKVNTRLQSFFFFFLSYLMREASSAPCEGPFCRQSCMCVRLHDNCGGLCNVRCAAANKKTPLWTDVMRLQLHYTPVVLFIFINCSRNVLHSRLGVVYSAAPLTDYFILFMGWIFLNLTLLYYPVYVELIKMSESGEELTSMKIQVKRKKQSQLINQMSDTLTEGRLTLKKTEVLFIV